MSEKWMLELFRMLYKLYRKQNRIDGTRHPYVWASNDETGEFMVYTVAPCHGRTIKKLLNDAAIRGDFE